MSAPRAVTHRKWQEQGAHWRGPVFPGGGPEGVRAAGVGRAVWAGPPSGQKQDRAAWRLLWVRMPQGSCSAGDIGTKI